MRQIKISNAKKVEAEISARSYKKLCQHLKGYNRKQLWKIMDHYIFHVMEDHHVEELLKILDNFEKTDSLEDPITPTPKSPMPEDGGGQKTSKQEQPSEVVITSAAVEEVDIPIPERRMEFTTPITAEDLKHSKTKLDLLYDVNYFTYLTPATAQTNAKKLLEYAEANELSAPAHWHFIAASDDFLTLEDEEEGDALE